MNLWKAQKLVAPVQTIPGVSNQEKESLNFFKRGASGAGNDERPTLLKDEIEKWAMVSKIDKGLRQKTLLMSLQDDSRGLLEKQELVRLAASSEGLLPEGFAKEVLTSPSVVSGGIFKNWDFEF